MARKILLFVLYIILVVCFWNLFEWFYLTVITHRPYRFDMITCIVIPLATGVVVYAVISLIEFFKKKRSGKSANNSHDDDEQNKEE